MALGGPSYAARLIGGGQIKKNAIRSKHVKKNSLTGKDVRNNSLTGPDIDESTLEIHQPSSLPPSGPAGGDLTGEYPNPALGANTVGTRELEDKSVNAAKIADLAVTGFQLDTNAVTTSKLANSSITAEKLGSEAVTSAKIGPGAVRAAQLAVIVTRQETVSVASGASGAANPVCEPRERRIGGGAFWSPLSNNRGVQASFATANNGWGAQGRNNTAVEANFVVQVLCVAA